MNDNTKSIKRIRSCPFCGGHASIIRKSAENGFPGYAGRCASCGAVGPVVIKQPWHDDFFVTQCIAAREWNNRVGGKKRASE